MLALLCDSKKYSNLTLNFNLYQLTWLTCLTNTIITGLIKYIVDIVGNIAEGIININYKIIIIKGTSLALKHNKIGIIVLIKLYFYFLATVIKNTQF